MKALILILLAAPAFATYREYAKPDFDTVWEMKELDLVTAGQKKADITVMRGKFTDDNSEVCVDGLKGMMVCSNGHQPDPCVFVEKLCVKVEK